MTKKKITIDVLAGMVQRGFEHVDKRFNQVDKQFEQTAEHLKGVEGRLDQLDNRLYNLGKDVSEIKRHFISRYEFEDLADRVRHLEKRIGLKSRK